MRLYARGLNQWMLSSSQICKARASKQAAQPMGRNGGHAVGESIARGTHVRSVGPALDMNLGICPNFSSLQWLGGYEAH